MAWCYSNAQYGISEECRMWFPFKSLSKVLWLFIFPPGKTFWGSWMLRGTSQFLRAPLNRGMSFIIYLTARAPQTFLRTCTNFCRRCPPWRTSITNNVPSLGTLGYYWIAAAAERLIHTTLSLGKHLSSVTFNGLCSVDITCDITMPVSKCSSRIKQQTNLN